MNEFKEDTNADIWLIAYAKLYGHTVVTYEASAPWQRTKVKIPDACAANNVACVTLIGMLQALGVTI